MAKQSPAKIVEQTNALAHKLYGLMGHQRPGEFKFYEATHPQEVLMWEMACHAQWTLREINVPVALAIMGTKKAGAK
jgi:hypothetical protein